MAIVSRCTGERASQIATTITIANAMNQTQNCAYWLSWLTVCPNQ